MTYSGLDADHGPREVIRALATSIGYILDSWTPITWFLSESGYIEAVLSPDMRLRIWSDVISRGDENDGFWACDNAYASRVYVLAGSIVHQDVPIFLGGRSSVSRVGRDGQLHEVVQAIGWDVYETEVKALGGYSFPARRFHSMKPAESGITACVIHMTDHDPPIDLQWVVSEIGTPPPGVLMSVNDNHKNTDAVLFKNVRNDACAAILEEVYDGE